MTSKLCKCGCEEGVHWSKRKNKPCCVCSCEKFQPEDETCNHPWQDARLDCKYCNPKQKKGCGKHYCDNKIWFNCGDRWGNLCPSCSNQSHTGQNPLAHEPSKTTLFQSQASQGRTKVNRLDSEPGTQSPQKAASNTGEVVSPLVNHRKSGAIPQEGTYTLSDKVGGG